MMVLFGVVVGTTSVGNQTALYLQSPRENLGTASGLSRTFGEAAALAIVIAGVSALSHSHLIVGEDGTPPGPPARNPPHTHRERTLRPGTR